MSKYSLGGNIEDAAVPMGVSGSYRPAAAKPPQAGPAKTSSRRPAQKPPPPASAPLPASGPPRRRGRPPIGSEQFDARPQTRGTSTQVPAKVFDRVERLRQAAGMSTGEIVASAISAFADRLPELIGTPPTGMFETRATRIPRPDKSPMKQLSYRLTPNDLALIDKLVDQHAARSRSHLITAALEAYLSQAENF